MANTQSSGVPDPHAVRRLRLRFTGEVQGVGFRWTARRVAQGLGLVGWVRNEPDGSVSMELQGYGDDIARYFTLFDRSYARFPFATSSTRGMTSSPWGRGDLQGQVLSREVHRARRADARCAHLRSRGLR